MRCPRCGSQEFKARYIVRPPDIMWICGKCQLKLMGKDKHVKPAFEASSSEDKSSSPNPFK